MPRGRRRKIEVPTDTRPHLELRDTAQVIERRREREERDERGENKIRGTERVWRERGRRRTRKGEKREPEQTWILM